MSLIPITKVYKVKSTTKNAEGKEETKFEERTQVSYSHTSWLEESNNKQIYDMFQQK